MQTKQKGPKMLKWLDLPCEECDADVGEQCFEKDRVWGKIYLKNMHQTRIKAVLHANRSQV